MKKTLFVFLLVFVFGILGLGLVQAQTTPGDTTNTSTGSVPPPPPPLQTSGGTGFTQLQTGTMGTFQQPMMQPNQTFQQVPMQGGTGQGIQQPGFRQGFQQGMPPQNSMMSQPFQGAPNNFQQGSGMMGGFSGGGGRGESQDFRGNQDAGNFQQGQQQGQEEWEKRQKQQEEQMLKRNKQGLTQMERSVTSLEKRIAAIEKKGGVASADLKTAIQKAKEVISKTKSAATMEEFQESGLEEMGDVMQNVNEEMQKAEMSLQFPEMLKQANRVITQQQKSLKNAQTRASRLKVNLESLLTKWQKSVDDMVQAVSQAQQSFQSGNTEDAVTFLKDNVFDAMQDIGENQRVFEMMANSQKVLKSVDQEMGVIGRRITALKKQSKDTAGAEGALTDTKAKVETVRQYLAQAGLDPDTLISAIEDAEDARQVLYEEMSDLTGQKYGDQTEGIPGLNFQQLQAPSMLQQYFKPTQGGPGEMMGGGGQSFGPTGPSFNSGFQSSGGGFGQQGSMIPQAPIGNQQFQNSSVMPSTQMRQGPGSEAPIGQAPPSNKAETMAQVINKINVLRQAIADLQKSR